MKSVISLGPINISLYSLCILVGIILAFILIRKESKRFNIKDDFISNLIFWCVIYGIVGARIYYVLFNLDYYMHSPIEIIKVWNGGLAIHGGIIAGLITLIYFCKKEKVSIIKILDISCIGLIVGQACGRWGNFFNMEAYGSEVTRSFLENLHLPEFIINGMHIGGHYYHPTFFYESLFCVLGLIIMLLIRRIPKIKQGMIISFYLVWYGILRYFIEGLRTDSLMLGNIKVAQLVSILFILLGIIGFILSIIKKIDYNKIEKNIKDKRIRKNESKSK